MTELTRTPTSVLWGDPPTSSSGLWGPALSFAFHVHVKHLTIICLPGYTRSTQCWPSWDEMVSHGPSASPSLSLAGGGQVGRGLPGSGGWGHH